MKKLLFLLVLLFTLIPTSIYAESKPSSEYIYSYDTEKTEDTPCQLSVNLENNALINESCYVNIINTTTNVKYRIPLHQTNNYFDYIYLPEGTFTIEEVNTYNKTTYTFSYPEQISTVLGTVTELHINVKNTTETNTEAATDSSVDNKQEETTATNQSLADNSAQKHDYIYSHTGTGTSDIILNGEFTSEAYIDIKIVKAGKPGEAQFVYSLDKKQTFSEAITIPLSGNVNVETFNLVFDGNYEIDDEFSFFCPDPSKVLNYKYKGSLKIEVYTEQNDIYAYDIFKNNNYKLVLNIKKSGNYGIAVFEYSLDGGKTYSEEMLVPENGIYKIPDSELYIRFIASSSAYEFTAGTTVTISYESKEASNGGAGLLILLLTGALIAGYIWLLNKKKKDTDYRINRWNKIE